LIQEFKIRVIIKKKILSNCDSDYMYKIHCALFPIYS